MSSSMQVQISDPTNADPMVISADVSFSNDMDTCTMTMPIDSPIYSRLSVSGLRRYTVSVVNGTETWHGTLTRWRPGGNKLTLTIQHTWTDQHGDEQREAITEA